MLRSQHGINKTDEYFDEIIILLVDKKYSQNEMLIKFIQLTDCTK